MKSVFQFLDIIRLAGPNPYVSISKVFILSTNVACAQKFDERNFLDFSLIFCQKKEANLEEIVDCVCRILELRSIRIQKAEISYFSKIILVNTCWLFSTLGEVVKSFLLSRNFLEILKNQHFYDFITSPRVEKSQQALTKIIFVEKYDISAFWIRIW